MENKDFLALLVDIHNRLAEISVHGDDTIRMGNVLQMCRSAIMDIQKGEPEDKQGE